MKKIILHLICLIGFVWIFSLPAFSEPSQLGIPLTFESLSHENITLPQDRVLGERALRVSVDPQSWQASRNFYYSHYVGSEGAAMNWTGNHSSCDAGTTSQAYKDALLLELNYFRAMAGVPAEVSFLAEYNTKAQEAALMMSVNSDLSHTPPASWTCYTADGSEAAGKSNLMLGYPSLSHIIAGYMKDKGPSNYPAGHRRWVLYPQTQLMGTGDVPGSVTYPLAANALWVIDSHIWDPRPTTREEYVAWPPPGYVPYQVIYPRWSFAYAGASFGSATVTMTQNGSPISLVLETYYTGCGENTLVWRPFSMADDSTWPAEHLVTYSVTVSNVMISGSPRSFNYNVTVFNPTEPVPPTPTVPPESMLPPAINFLLYSN